jgi:DNA-directed RNA polymerase subunit M/transcription elongation factor TFIIS
MRKHAARNLYNNVKPIVHDQIKKSKCQSIIDAFPSTEEVANAITTVEKGVFQRFGMTDPHRYVSRFVHILVHIQRTNDSSGLINPETIQKQFIDIDLESNDLQCIINREVLHKVATSSEENIDDIVERVLGVSGGAGLICSKCNEQDVTYTLQQIRSADEGMTLICKCNNPKCGHSERID